MIPPPHHTANTCPPKDISPLYKQAPLDCPTTCLPACSRERLFNIIISVFLTFYAGFALLYPHHDALHLNIMADQLTGVLPTGLLGELTTHAAEQLLVAAMQCGFTAAGFHALAAAPRPD